MPGRLCNNDRQVCDPNAECVRLADYDQFVCQCQPGYTGDGYTCTGRRRPPNDCLLHCNDLTAFIILLEAPKFEGSFLIASQGMSIVRMPLQALRGDLGRPIVMQPLQTAVGVDIDCTAGHIYWSDVSRKVIKRSNYNGSNVEVFIKDGKVADGTICPISNIPTEFSTSK